MKILYTGASNFMQPQTNPDYSLGGYMSNSVIPNNKSKNLFGDESYNMLTNANKEVRGIVIFNDKNVQVNNVLIGVKPKNNIRNYELKVAIVELAGDNETEMERVPNVESEPIYASFEKLYMLDDDDINNMFELGDMPSNKKFGIWLLIEYKDNNPFLPIVPGKSEYSETFVRDFKIDQNTEGEKFSHPSLIGIDVLAIIIDNMPIQNFTFDKETGELDLTAIGGIWNGSLLSVLYKRMVLNGNNTNQEQLTPSSEHDNKGCDSVCTYYKAVQNLNKIEDGFDIIIKND